MGPEDPSTGLGQFSPGCLRSVQSVKTRDITHKTFLTVEEENTEDMTSVSLIVATALLTALKN